MGSAKPADRPRVDKGLPYEHRLKIIAGLSKVTSTQGDSSALGKLATRKLKEIMAKQGNQEERLLPPMGMGGDNKRRRLSQKTLGSRLSREDSSRRLVNNFTGTLKIQRLKERKVSSPREARGE